MKPAPKSRRNEPAYLPHVARVIAAARGVTTEQVASETTATARAFFGMGIGPKTPIGAEPQLPA
jgi:TatD DNase family protein